MRLGLIQLEIVGMYLREQRDAVKVGGRAQLESQHLHMAAP